MATDIGEKIKVMAVFEKGVRPVKFKWRGRVYPVKEITYTWASKEGEAPIIHFSVTDGATLFELAYNQNELERTLNKVDA